MLIAYSLVWRWFLRLFSWPHWFFYSDKINRSYDLLAQNKWEELADTLATVKFLAKINPDFCFLKGEVARSQQAHEDALKHYEWRL